MFLSSPWINIITTKCKINHTSLRSRSVTGELKSGITLTRGGTSSKKPFFLSTDLYSAEPPRPLIRPSFLAAEPRRNSQVTNSSSSNCPAAKFRKFETSPARDRQQDGNSPWRLFQTMSSYWFPMLWNFYCCTYCLGIISFKVCD